MRAIQTIKNRLVYPDYTVEDIQYDWETLLNQPKNTQKPQENTK